MQNVRIITTFSFAFLLLGAVNLYASNDTGGKDKDGKDKTEAKVKVDSDDKKPNSDPDNKKKKETAASVEEKIVASEDSTSNSLNKLNSIFYFIYKHKYNAPAEAIAQLFD